MIELVFPVMIGDQSKTVDLTSGEEVVTYSSYTRTKCHPDLSQADVMVQSVKAKCAGHLANQCLGALLMEDLTVKTIMEEMLACQGCYIIGEKNQAFELLKQKVLELQNPN